MDQAVRIAKLARRTGLRWRGVGDGPRALAAAGARSTGVRWRSRRPIVIGSGRAPECARRSRCRPRALPGRSPEPARKSSERAGLIQPHVDTSRLRPRRRWPPGSAPGWRPTARQARMQGPLVWQEASTPAVAAVGRESTRGQNGHRRGNRQQVLEALDQPELEEDQRDQDPRSQQGPLPGWRSPAWRRATEHGSRDHQ